MATGGQVKGNDLTAGASYDSGNIAVLNDLVAVPRVFTQNIIDSAAALAGIDLDLFRIDSGRNAGFGSASTPIALVADEMSISGSGGVHVLCGNGALVTDFLRVWMDAADAVCTFGSSGTSTWKDVDLDRGNITFAGSSLFHASALFRIGNMGQPNDVKLTIAAAAPTLPSLKQASGTSFVNNELTDLDMMGPSTCTKDEKKCVTANIGDGATFIYNHKSLAGESLNFVVHPGGKLDLMGNTEPKVLDNVHVKWGGDIEWLNRPKMHTITTYRNDNDQ